MKYVLYSLGNLFSDSLQEVRHLIDRCKLFRYPIEQKVHQTQSRTIYNIIKTKGLSDILPLRAFVSFLMI